MPLAFSTLGCPDADLPEVLRLAQRFAVKGLELRSGEGQLVHPGLTAVDRRNLRQALENHDLRLLSVASYLRLLGQNEPPANKIEVTSSEAAAMISLASDLQAGGLRVFPGGVSTLNTTVQNTTAQSDEQLFNGLAALSLAAQGSGVQILLETHDQYRKGADIGRVMRLLEAELPGHNVRVIWDLRHSWQAGEPVVETYSALKPWLGYLQLKDLRSDGELSLPGDGELPLREAVQLVGPEQWFSLEWELAWNPELPALEDALAALQKLELFGTQRELEPITKKEF